MLPSVLVFIVGKFYHYLEMGCQISLSLVSGVRKFSYSICIKNFSTLVPSIEMTALLLSSEHCSKTDLEAKYENLKHKQGASTDSHMSGLSF